MGKKKEKTPEKTPEVNNTLAGFVGLLFIGWIINLVLVIKLAFSGITLGSLTIFNFFQIVGILVPPLGSILGFVGLF
jgi:uncharacterized membrane protein